MVPLPTARRRMFAVQNLLAGLVFALLCVSQAAAYLLHLYPGTEFFWRLSVPLYRITAPVLDVYDTWVPIGPVASCLGLAAVCAMPFVAQVRNSWLGTSSAGHVALALCVIMTMSAWQRAGTQLVFADLSPLTYLSTTDTGSAGLAVAAMLLVPLCALNHVIFFQSVRRPRR